MRTPKGLTQTAKYGWDSFSRGVLLENCPYLPFTKGATEWRKGWCRAQESYWKVNGYGSKPEVR